MAWYDNQERIDKNIAQFRCSLYETTKTPSTVCVSNEQSQIEQKREINNLLSSLLLIALAMAIVIITVIYILRLKNNPHKGKYLYLEQYASWRVTKLFTPLVALLAIVIISFVFPWIFWILIIILGFSWYPLYLLLRRSYIYITGYRAAPHRNSKEVEI